MKTVVFYFFILSLWESYIPGQNTLKQPLPPPLNVVYYNHCSIVNCFVMKFLLWNRFKMEIKESTYTKGNLCSQFGQHHLSNVFLLLFYSFLFSNIHIKSILDINGTLLLAWLFEISKSSPPPAPPLPKEDIVT